LKTTTIRDFRSRIAELIDSDEPVLVTRHGKNAAVLFPLHDPKKIPLDLRRKLFFDLTNDIAKQLDAKGPTDEDVERAFTSAKKRRRR
jgi:prevent-host-death family protein